MVISEEWDEIDGLKKLAEEALNTCYSDQNTTIIPSSDDVFNAFRLCPPQEVKVVIIGQDPYPTEGMADGLAFSVRAEYTKNNKITQNCSLINIMKKVEGKGIDDKLILNSGDLSYLASQGVLLLNTALTYKKNSSKKKPSNEHMIAWKEFTYEVLNYLLSTKDRPFFIIWGNKAKEIFTKVTTVLKIEGTDFYITGVHPSPQSAYLGFFNSDYFKIANGYVKTILKKEEIKWKSDSEK